MSRWDDYDSRDRECHDRGRPEDEKGRSSRGGERGDRSEREMDRERDRGRRDEVHRPSREGEDRAPPSHSAGRDRGGDERGDRNGGERQFEGGLGGGRGRGRGGGPDRGGRRGKRRGPEMEENESMYDWGKKDNPEDEEKEGGGGNGEGGEGDEEGDKPKVKKVKPNMERSGKLQEEALKTESGVVLKFVDPPEAKRPSKKWRLYPFKGDQALDVIPVHHMATYLFGRDRAVAAIPTDHISCSKQHAALVHREINIKDELGIGPGRMVNKPYIIDLVSANGTFLNGKRIDASRFYELKPKDVLKFGQSSREYVLLHDELAKS